MHFGSFFPISYPFTCSGIPKVQDLVSIYCGCRRIPPSLPDLNFYLALSMFKMAAIAQVCKENNALCIFVFSCLIRSQIQKNSYFCFHSSAQGVYARYLLGNASAPNAAEFGQCVEPLAKIALQIGKRSELHMCGAERSSEKSADADLKLR